MSETPLFDLALRDHIQIHGRSPFEPAPALVPIAPRPRSRPRKRAAAGRTTTKTNVKASR